MKIQELPTPALFATRKQADEELEVRATRVLLALGTEEEDAKSVISVHQTMGRDNKPLVCIKYGEASTEEYRWVPLKTFYLLAEASL